MITTHSEPKTLRIWAFGDAHVGTDMKHGRESLRDAIHQSEFGGAMGGPSFAWDFAIDPHVFSTTNSIMN